MKYKATMGDRFKAEIERQQSMGACVGIGSVWDYECYDKHGNLKWTEKIHNTVTNEGLDALLNIMFHAATQLTTWYILLFESDTTPSGATTYATPVFTESTAYTEANRVEYNEAEASSQSITNSANKASFTINATKTMYGGALVGGGTDANTKGDAAGGGTMFCASKFASAKEVESGDTLKVMVTITAADA